MSKSQMHVFNWFFLFIIAAVVILHVWVSHDMLAAGKIHGGIEPSLFIVATVFVLIWLIMYVIQIKTFKTKTGQVCIVINGLLTGIWILTYTFLNFG